MPRRNARSSPKPKKPSKPRSQRRRRPAAAQSSRKSIAKRSGRSGGRRGRSGRVNAAPVVSVSTTARVRSAVLSPLFKRATLTAGVLALPGKLLPIARSGRPVPHKSMLWHVRRVRAQLGTGPGNREAHAILNFLEQNYSRESEAPAVTLTNPSAVAPGTGLSDCSALYGKAMSNVFGTFEELPCVPSTPPSMCQRVRGFMRGIFVTGTNGIGFLAVSPYRADNGGGKTVASFSAALYTAGAATPFAVAAGSAANLEVDFPYTLANFTNGMETRLVACGVRWRNISQASNVGGVTVALAAADDMDYTGFSYNTLMANPSSVVIPNAIQPLKIGEEQNTWSTLLWRPREMEGLDTLDGAAYTAQANTFSLLIACEAPSVAAVQVFEYEVVTFVEYSGIANNAGVITAVNSLSTSDADEVGLDRVLEGLQRAPLDLAAGSWAEQATVGIVDAVAHSDTTARTSELIEGSDGLGLGKVINMANSLLGYFLA